ncbi:MAG: 50S ribosomal protein L29 [Rhizobiales bacterium TMED168]|nr:MAG: 50S ribosomal protein L29 [Rhizobiales bacterium TMED168]|tara:strand:+ start:18520 stop:18729 length:210 start_codon:yes stop_codon:yes gene_type:complete
MAKKKKDINDMSIDELLDSLNDLKKEVFNINIQKLAGQFEDTSQISKKKKDIARIKTIMSKNKKEVSNA